MPHEPGHTEDQNLVTCWDGSQKSNYTDCPNIENLWTPAGYDNPATETVEGTGEEGLRTEGWISPAWWDDPETIDKNEYREYIYEGYGGHESLGLTLEQFWEDHSDKFPTWEETYGQRYSDVLTQIGMLNSSIELANNVYNLKLESLDIGRESQLETATTQKEGLSRQVESQFMTSGGVVGGRQIEATEAASENIDQALTLGLRGINVDEDLLTEVYKGDLTSIENQRINYRQELVSLEDQFEEKLTHLIATEEIGMVTEETLEFESYCERNGGTQTASGDCILLPDARSCRELGCESGCVEEFGGDAHCVGGDYSGELDTGVDPGGDCHDNGDCLCYENCTDGKCVAKACYDTEQGCASCGGGQEYTDESGGYECHNDPEGPCCPSSSNYDPCNPNCKGADCPLDEDRCVKGGGTWSFIEAGSAGGTGVLPGAFSLGGDMYYCSGGDYDEYEDHCPCRDGIDKCTGEPCEAKPTYSTPFN